MNDWGFQIYPQTETDMEQGVSREYKASYTRQARMFRRHDTNATATRYHVIIASRAPRGGGALEHEATEIAW